MRILIMVLFFIQAVLFCQEEGPSLRVLIVHDVTPALQKVFPATETRATDACAKLAAKIGYRCIPTILSSGQFSQQAFQAWLQTLRSPEKKMVVFYYCGQGEHNKAGERKVLCFTSEKGERFSLDMVQKQIWSCRPTPCFVIFRCCITPLPSQSRTVVTSVVNPKPYGVPGLDKLTFENWVNELVGHKHKG